MQSSHQSPSLGMTLAILLIATIALVASAANPKLRQADLRDLGQRVVRESRLFPPRIGRSGVLEDDALREHEIRKRDPEMFLLPRMGRSPGLSAFPRIGRAPGLGSFPRIGRGLGSFPRIGRSPGLAAFPRIGRDVDTESILLMERAPGLSAFPRIGRAPGLGSFPRIGRTSGPNPFPRVVKNPGLGFFPRIGRDLGTDDSFSREDRAPGLGSFPRIGRNSDMDSILVMARAPGLGSFPRIGRDSEMDSMARARRSPSLGAFPRIGRGSGMTKSAATSDEWCQDCEQELVMLRRAGLNDAFSPHLGPEHESSNKLSDAGKRPESFVGLPLAGKADQWGPEEDPRWFAEPLAGHAGKRNDESEAERNGLWFGPRLGRKRRDVQ